MRRIIFFLTFLNFTVCSGQVFQTEDSLSKKPVYILNPILPKYKGGMKKFMKDINRELNLDKSIEGSLWIETKVTSDGEISVIEITKGISPEVDQKITDAISKLQKWSSAERLIPRKKQTEKVKCSMPIRIVIEKGKVKR